MKITFTNIEELAEKILEVPFHIGNGLVTSGYARPVSDEEAARSGKEVKKAPATAEEPKFDTKETR